MCVEENDSMNLYPDLYVNNIKDITLEILNKNKITGCSKW